MLSQTCEYALRAATYIAQHADEGPVLAKDIAEETNVPLKYLQKVLRDLVRVGVLASARGIGGGFTLRRPAKQVRLVDVAAPFDDLAQRISCPFGNPECGGQNPCPVHNRWVRVVEPYQRFLQTTTLAQLAKERPGWRVRTKASRSRTAPVRGRRPRSK